MSNQTTAGRSAWAENILDSIMPIILANAPQGIGDRDYEAMVKSIMARLPDEQKPVPITLTAAEAAQKIMTMWPWNGADVTAKKAEIAQMIATIQAEARAEGAMVKLHDYAAATPPIDPIAWQAAADRLMQWADRPGAKELAERTRTAAQALPETGPAPLATPQERAEHVYSATIWQYLRLNQNMEHAQHQITSHIAHEIEQAMAQPTTTGLAGGRLSIHVTVDDLMPAIKTQIGRIVAAKVPEAAKEAIALAADWIASTISQPHNIDTRMLDDGRHILRLLTEAHSEGVE